VNDDLRAAETRRSRVAVVLSGYGVVERGAEIMLAQLLPRLAPRFEIHTYSRSGAGPGGIRRAALSRDLLARPYARWRWLRKVLDTLFLDPLHLEWTSHLLLSLPSLLGQRYDVVWHETGLWGGLILGIVRRFTGVRLLDVAHASHPGWELPFARRRPDAYVVPTRAFGRLVASRVPELRVEVIPQGVDCDQFAPNGDTWPLTVRRPLVLAVGALSREKRPELLVDAVSRTDLSLVLAGDGPLAASLDDRANRLLPPDRYQRLSLARDFMPQLYRAADVVALASPFEALSFALLEALACNRPVVSVDDEVRREIVADAGILVRGSDPDAWGRALTAAADCDWADRPRRRALDFDLGATAASYGNLLTQLAENRS
jgi:glycosyltransferase involved in cell wall biosynthesis